MRTAPMVVSAGGGTEIEKCYPGRFSKVGS